MHITEIETACLSDRRIPYKNPYRNIEYRSVAKQFAVVFSYEKNGKKMESVLGVFNTIDEAIAARDKYFAKRSEVPNEVAA
jgi:hypothetical protein